MKIKLTSTYVDHKNKYILYCIVNNKKKKIHSGYLRGNDCIDINIDDETDNLILKIYPKYFSMWKWRIVAAIVGILGLLGSYFLSFFDYFIMYQEFEITTTENGSDVQLHFNGADFTIKANDNSVKITSKIKGKLYSFFFSLTVLLLFTAVIVIWVVCLKYRPSAI